MVNVICPVNDLAQQHRIRDGTRSDGQPFVVLNGIKIDSATRTEIVEHSDVMPALQQQFGEVTSDETCSTGHKTVCHDNLFRVVVGAHISPRSEQSQLFCTPALDELPDLCAGIDQIMKSNVSRTTQPASAVGETTLLNSIAGSAFLIPVARIK